MGGTNVICQGLFLVKAVAENGHQPNKPVAALRREASQEEEFTEND